MSEENQPLPNTLRLKANSWLPSIGLLALLLTLAATKPAPQQPEAWQEVKSEYTSSLTQQ